MNLATNSMERLTKMLGKTDARLKEFGIEPYGMRKTTPKEQRQMYESLTEEQLFDLYDREGYDAVNKFLSRYEPKEDAWQTGIRQPQMPH